MRALYHTFAQTIEKRFRIDAGYFLKGGFWLSVGQAATILLGLLTTVLLAQYLSEAQYGIYRYLIGLAAIFSAFSLTGLGQAILQTAARKYYSFYQKTLRTNFTYSLIITLFSLIGAGYYWINENTTLSLGCFLIAILQPFITTYGNTAAFLQGSSKFRESTLLHTARMLFVSLATIGVLFLTKSIIALFATYLLANLFANLASHLVLTVSSDKNKINFDRYLGYAKHTSAQNIVSTISSKIDTLFIFTQLGAIELALYSIAIVIPEQIKGSLKNLATLILPKYSKNTDKNLVRRSIPKRSWQLFLLLCIVSLLYIIIAPYIYELLFPKYIDAVIYSQLAALSFPAAVAIIPISYMQSNLSNRLLYIYNLISSVMNIAFIAIGVIFFGIIGVIIARLIHRYLSAIITYLIYKKH